MAAQPVRGLVKFITELNACSSSHDFDHRVREEITKIRSRFEEHGLSGYEKKKCLLKLLYIHMLGHEIDFGYVESVQLMASSSYQEKSAGYMGYDILVINHDDFRTLGINTVSDDLRSSNFYVQALALNHIANSWCPVLRASLYDDVLHKLLLQPFESPRLRKKVYMCVLQFLRMDRSSFPLHDWKRKMHDLLSREGDFGCLMALINLLLEFIKIQCDVWDHCIPLVLESFMRLLSGSAAAETYHSLTSPWLMQKLLTVLVMIKPSSEARYLQTLIHVLNRLVDNLRALDVPPHSRGTANDKEFDAKLIWLLRVSISMEAVRVIVHWIPFMPTFSMTAVLDFMSRLLSSRSSHVCIIAVEMAEFMLANDTFLPMLKTMLAQFLRLLTSNDPTVRCRAVYVISKLCDESNWGTVVPDFLAVLRSSDMPTQRVIAPLILDAVSRSIPPGPLYVDFVFKVVQFTNEYSALQTVPLVLDFKSPMMGELIATKCVNMLSELPVNDALVHICALMLDEYGHLIESKQSTKEQATLLQRYYVLGNSDTKAVVLVTLAKFASRDSALRPLVERFVESQINSEDHIVQSTACELLRLMLLGNSLFDHVVNGKQGPEGSIIEPYHSTDGHNKFDGLESYRIDDRRRQYKDQPSSSFASSGTNATELTSSSYSSSSSLTSSDVSSLSV
ncbi:Adaptin N terminal region family protein [Babesia bovis T2Bo]|uniref:Clathrin/coatomer adaptor adaptin-like N-terminal domain-containing protein n=1 Tax=Babesia bovis TaxID=5865 RepID=A7AW44_BABBO|nr:Adaptin N terminal region family protein [Babesia bovis T2Bo]EDO05272.1 Adaptin N terminal region family protein [Babesia bovis T2Bo]|eukprot:XP_001608840.1 hypothetical protein [Babesia bovis T2Bo]